MTTPRKQLHAYAPADLLDLYDANAARLPPKSHVCVRALRAELTAAGITPPPEPEPGHTAPAVAASLRARLDTRPAPTRLPRESDEDVMRRLILGTSPPYTHAAVARLLGTTRQAVHERVGRLRLRDAAPTESGAEDSA